MDVPASTNGRRFQASLAVGQLLLPRPHLARRNTLGLLSLHGPNYAINFNKYSDKPLDILTVDALHTLHGQLQVPLDRAWACAEGLLRLLTNQLGSSLEILETLVVALEKMRREEDDLSEDCNTLFSFVWTLVDHD
jgi:hypothetical protein